METRIRLLGVANVVLSGFELLSGLVVYLTFATIKEYLGIPSLPGWIGWALAVLPILMLMTSVPGLFAGIGILRRSGWARFLTLFLSLFRIFSFPLGTVLAIWAFIVLTHDDAREYFRARH